MTYWLNRKSCCVPEIGLVTVLSQLTMTGAGRLVVQIGEVRLVVDCRVKPVKLVGQDKLIFGPIGVMVSWGGNEMLNIVPLPPLPPKIVVP